jgi:hypothetical protein
VLGSNEPIRFDPEEIRRRIHKPAVQDYYRRAGIDVEALLEPYLTTVPVVIDEGEAQSATPADLNHDLYPRDEFSVPRS